jgi:membrane protease subunit (stomatin/prohibitin family)
VTTNNVRLWTIVGIGMMSILLLYTSLALPLQVAQGKQQKNAEKSTTKESTAISQKNKCKDNAKCLNIVCTKNALCLIGYNAPFLMSTPH